MGNPERADPDKIPDLGFIDETPESARIKMIMPTKANYQLMTDNILDLSHADYLHPTSLGGAMAASKATVREEGDRIIAEWVSKDCIPPPAYAPIVAPATKADIWTEVVWHAPALMILGTAAMPAGTPRVPKDESYTLHNMTPETSRTTHYFVCNTCPFLRDDPAFDAYLRQAISHAFLTEDKPMLEKQQARIGDADLWSLHPILLRSDSAAVRVRRKLDSLIAQEQNG